MHTANEEPSTLVEENFSNERNVVRLSKEHNGLDIA